MSEDPSKRRLGRGLAALIGDMDKPGAESASAQQISADRKIPIELVSANPNNPRRKFKDGELFELAGSLRKHGIVQPVVVRPVAEGRFEIIAGERRWRAAQLAGLTEIPVIIRDVDDRTALEIAIIENIQRADLNPVEEAQGYQALISQYKYLQEDLAKVVGRSRSHVANTMRLLVLPPSIREMMIDGKLTAGHARALIPLQEPHKLAQMIAERGLSVREAERLAKVEMDRQNGAVAPKPDKTKDADTTALERSLSDHLGLTVQVNHKGDGGQIKIQYKSLEQLEKICKLLEGQ